MTRKSCPYCYSSNVNKHGVRNNKQCYQCRACHTCWTNLSRPERMRANIWHDYVFERQTIRQLSRTSGKGHICIRAALEAYLPPIEVDCPRPVTVILDATYFSGWGLLVVIDPYADRTKSQNLTLYWKELEGTEHTFDYDVATDTLAAMGYHIQAAVIDGRRGVRKMLLAKDIPVQQCQFHQLQTITQCLTKRPKLVQNIELRAIALTLTKTTKAAFTAKLDAWHEKHMVTGLRNATLSLEPAVSVTSMTVPDALILAYAGIWITCLPTSKKTSYSKTYEYPTLPML